MRSSRNGATDRSLYETLRVSSATNKSLLECWEVFQEDRLAQLAVKTQQNYTTAAKLIPAGRKPLRSYEPADIAKLLKPLRPGAYMVARGFLSSLFSFGIARGWAVSNPVRHVETRKLGHIARIARDEARKAIQAAPDPELSLLFETQYACGQRLSDVLAAKPVNLQGNLLVLKQQKTGNIVNIELPANITERLLALGRKPCEPFFKIRPQKVWREWRKIRTELGLNMRQSPHSFRKAASCEAAEGGASEAELQSLLGHKTPRAAALYRLEADNRTLASSAMSKRNLAHGSAQEASE